MAQLNRKDTRLSCFGSLLITILALCFVQVMLQYQRTAFASLIRQTLAWVYEWRDPGCGNHLKNICRIGFVNNTDQQGRSMRAIG